jgi:hypothetical protein
MSQGLTYNIDIAFCVDVTGSMSPVIDLVKERVVDFADDLAHRLRAKDKVASQIRARVIAFRERSDDSNSLEKSHFYTLFPAEQTSEFSNLVSGLTAAAGDDNEPSSGLEALAFAMGSDWVQDGDRRRHIIVMFANSSPAARPEMLATLQHMWESGEGTSIGQQAKRLVLLAPDVHPWSHLGDGLDKSVFLPSRAGDTATEADYGSILDMCCNAV